MYIINLEEKYEFLSGDVKSNSEVRIGHVISSCKETCDQKSGYYIGDLISRRCDVRTGDHISPRMNAISRHAVLYESHIFLRIFSTKWKPKPRTVQACHVLKKLAVIQLTSMPQKHWISTFQHRFVLEFGTFLSISRIVAIWTSQLLSNFSILCRPPPFLLLKQYGHVGGTVPHVLFRPKMRH